MGFFQDLFGFAAGKKKPKLDQGPPLDVGISGMGDLLDRVRSRPIGFGDDFVSRQTKPAARQLEAGFERTRKSIGDEFGGRGLGRSTLAARDIGEAAAQKERDISSVISEAELQNLVQSKKDVQERDLLERAGLMDQQAQKERALGVGRDLAQRTRAAEAGLDEQRTQDASFAVGVPLAIGASVATGNPTFALSALGVNAGQVGSQDIISELKRRRTEETAKPFTS